MDSGPSRSSLSRVKPGNFKAREILDIASLFHVVSSWTWKSLDSQASFSPSQKWFRLGIAKPPLFWGSSALPLFSTTFFCVEPFQTKLLIRFIPLASVCRTKMTRKMWGTQIQVDRKTLPFSLWNSHLPPPQCSLGWDPSHFLLQVRIAGVDINTNSWVQHFNCKYVTFTSNADQAEHSKINYNFASKYSTIAHTVSAELAPQCIMSRIGAVLQSIEKSPPGWHSKVNSHRFELLHQYS